MINEVEDLEQKKELSMVSLDKKSKEIVEEIVEEDDSEKLKNLVAIFNANQSKKDIVRNDVFSRLLDSISVQMLERFEKNPNAFSNKDLIEYLNAVKNAKSNKIDNIEQPAIQNNTQINVAVVKDGILNRESKERVISTVQSILKRLSDEQRLKDVQDENLEEYEE